MEHADMPKQPIKEWYNHKKENCGGCKSARAIIRYLLMMPPKK